MPELAPVIQMRLPSSVPIGSKNNEMIAAIRRRSLFSTIGNAPPPAQYSALHDWPPFINEFVNEMSNMTRILIFAKVSPKMGIEPDTNCNKS